MNSSNIVKFFFERIEETIDYKEYIKEVEVSYEYAESFGNEYIRMSYIISSSKDFDNLSFDERQTIFHKSSDHIFPISTHKQWSEEKKKLLRIIEFKNVYESLASYAIFQFEKHLKPGTPIKVKSIDLWPEANYAKKYFLNNPDRYSTVMRSHFENDVWNWSRLHQLAKTSRKTFLKQKKQFTITDNEISSLFGFKLDSIYSILLHHQVPIVTKGVATIEAVHIHAAKFVQALKEEIRSSEYVRKYQMNLYKNMIAYLYERHLPEEKNDIAGRQQSEFLKHFIIQKGDILELKDARLVCADSVSIDANNDIRVQYIMLKTNLQPSERTRTIASKEIDYILKESHFLEFTEQALVKHLSALGKWMSKRKIKFEFVPFKPDMTEGIENSVSLQQ